MDTNFAHLFEKFTSLNVLVVGDVMIDAYLWGQVNHISPEAPVPVLDFTRREYRLGGAANVALNVQAMGATPILCSVIGNDDKAQIFDGLLKNQDLTTDGILSNSSRITTTKTRVVANTQHVLRIDEEKNKPLQTKIEEEFMAHIEKIMAHQKIDAVIFEDYDKGCLTPNIIQHVVRLAYARHIPTLVDPKKRNFLNYHGVTLFKPNFKELCEGLKIEVDKKNYDDIFTAAKTLQQQMNIRYALITLSERGMLLSDGETYNAVPAELRNITDVSGAGDTVIAVAALCLATGIAPQQLVTIANLAGGLVCEQVGAVAINKKQLLEECLRKL